MSAERMIIFSDLDGTLLDHFTYQFEPAVETLAQLKCADIPVVLNTSKTQAELEMIKDELALNSPFIIENGAAVYIPKNTFHHQPFDTFESGNYWVKSFCFPRKYWLEILEEQASAFKPYYIGFSSLSENELSRLTGLSEAKAALAKQRQFGEPIHWVGDDKTKQAFIDLLSACGANVLHGGRFMHISGHCDKGKALEWLKQCYQEFYQATQVTTIALGDGNNDIAMLEKADIAVQVRSPVHDFPLLARQQQTIQTKRFGPAGWAEALQQILLTKLTNGVKYG